MSMNTPLDEAPPVDLEGPAIAYIRSDRFVTDAVDWASTGAHRHAALMELIQDFYADSPECNTMIDDIAAGAVTL
jgi:hypothetical protein